MTPYRRFLLLWAGQLLSRTGSGISAFALGVAVLHQTGSTSSYAALLLTAFVPAVVLAPLGGVIADRFDRRAAMVLGDLGAALGIGMVALAGTVSGPWAWIGVGLSSAFTALHGPAFEASITELLDEGDYARAGGMVQLAEASRFVVAPVVAALLLTRTELTWVLSVDVATFLAAAIAVIALPRPSTSPVEPRRSPEWWRDALDGVTYLRTHRAVARLLAVTAVVTFATGVLQALFAPLVLSFGDASMLGTVQSIGATGMLAGSVHVGTRGRTEGQRRVLAISLFAAGACVVLIGLSRTALTFTLASFAFFTTLPFVNTSLQVLFRQRIDAAVRGRVWSLIGAASQSTMLIAIGVTGFATEHWLDPWLRAENPLGSTLRGLVGTGDARGGALLVVGAGLGLMFHALSDHRRLRHG